MSSKIPPDLRRHIILIDSYHDIIKIRNKLQNFDNVQVITQKLDEVLEEISKFEQKNPKDSFDISFARILMKNKNNNP